MLKGGSLSTGLQGGGAGSGAPTQDTGAMVDSQMYASLMPQVPVYDSTVAKAEYRLVQPVADPLTSNEISFSIPSSSDEGVFYSLNESKLFSEFTNFYNLGPENSASFCLFGGAAMLWDSIRVELNGVNLAQSGATSALHAFDWLHKQLFLSEYRPFPHGRVEDFGVNFQQEYAPDGDSSIWRQYDASPPLILNSSSPSSGAHIGEESCAHGAYQWWRQNQQQNKLQVEVPRSHPAFQKGVILPAWCNIRVTLVKQSLGFPSYAIRQCITDSPTTVYEPTFDGIKFYLKTFRLTNSGLALWKSLEQQVGGVLRYPALCNRVSRFDIQAGVSQIDKTISVSTLTPQVLVIHLIDRANELTSMKTPTQNPLMTFCDPSGLTVPEIEIQPQSYYIEVGGVRMPANYSRTRDWSFSGRSRGAGTASLDYQAYRDAFGEGVPYLSEAAFNDGNWNILVFNISGQQLLGHRDPRREMASISFHATLATPTLNQGAIIVSQLSMEEFAIEKGSGRVSTTW